jgi:uncharacterized SAM-binding protein YcdF (DUF218 family)
MERAAVLHGAANLWVISDEAAPADAVAVLGGGVEVRPFAAAEYYRKGLINKILVADVRSRRTEDIGVVLSHVSLNRRVLMRLNVPESAIENFGDKVSNTNEEAIALREWAVRNSARRLIVPTEEFSARRVRWIMQRAFAGTGIDVRVPGLVDPDLSRAEWWKDEKGVVAFQNEVIKYVYYRVKY